MPTEVFLTRVKADQMTAYREWIGKVHQIESTFPGFQEMYVQAPSQENEGSWLTFLQFDTPENLDHWLNSKERQEVLKEGEFLIQSFENHRVNSSFAGWFQDHSRQGNDNACLVGPFSDYYVGA